MLLDSLDGMNALHAHLQRFVGSDEPALSLAADRSGSAVPYSELLVGLHIRIRRGQSSYGLASSGVSLDRESRVRHVSFFHFDKSEEGAHHHPELNVPEYIAKDSMTLIIEVDSGWIEELAVEAESQNRPR
jgi:hypothetical protein